MLESKKKNNVIDESFIRTCPVGVRSCFGATGFYDHEDTDKTNDICEYHSSNFLLVQFQKALFLFLKSTTRCEQFQYENSSSVILKVAFLRKMLMI